MANDLYVINKKKENAPYIFLLVVFILSVIGAGIYFGMLLSNESNTISGDSKSGDELILDDSGDMAIYIPEFSGEPIIDDEPSGEIIVSGETISELTNEPIEPTDVLVTLPNGRVIDPTKPMVALTFDDGPHYKNTEKLLEILDKYDARASFFDLGENMKKYPELVRKELEAGNDVGGHTYSHVDLNSLSSDEVLNEVAKNAGAFKEATGLELKYLRAPFGNANADTRSNINIPLVHWNVDALDWKYRNADKIIEEIRKTKNLDGRIILMHVIYDATLEAMDRLIPELQKEGYQIVTVSEMAMAKGKTFENGKIHYGF